ncbi:MAG: sulfatase, partial [Verrucomicrobiota bacterium]
MSHLRIPVEISSKPMTRNLFFALTLLLAGWTSADQAPNFLLITVDDMSADSLGSFGCPLPDTSPNIDALAKQSLKFAHAHVQVGNCYPSRNVMWSGRYPHNTGVEGFYKIQPIDFPMLSDVMQGAGYHCTIRGKVTHSTPYNPYSWDLDASVAPDGSKFPIKDVPSYGTSTTMGIEAAKAAGKPFCINVNISDPHKPFWYPNDKHPASKEFSAEEVPIPGFLFDDPEVREELALYYTSVRRADDAVGAILQALEDSGEADNTVIFFLSDHGMPLPFAKTQLYHHSSHTPLLIRWPGVTKDGSTDEAHMVSAVDFMPTLCDIAGIEHPEGFDGRSFEPLLRGATQEGRDFVYKVYNENSGRQRTPMRAVQTKDFLYLYNPWSDGERIMKTATKGTQTYKRMQALAETDDAIKARLHVMDHREREELYHIAKDPDCLVNLATNPEYEAQLAKHHTKLETIMTETGDH